VATIALCCWLLLLVPMLVGCAKLRGGEEGASAEGSEGAEVSEGAENPDGGDGADDGEDDDEEEQAIPVEVADLGRGGIEEVLKFSTNLEAESEVQVFAEADRQIRQLLVEEGDDVRRGQVLIRLQDEVQKTALARTRSQLEKAERDFARQKSLFEQQLISEQIYNEAAYDLEQLQLALADAERELGYTEVRAPIDGTVTQRMVNVGDHVTINQHLFDIVDFDSIVARVYVPEREIDRLAVGQEVRIFSEAFRSEERRGEVDRLAPIVDPKTGTVKVTVKIPRQEALLPGMYVSVELVTAVHDDALLVPKKALVYDADQIFVFRVTDDGTAERLLLETVLEDRENIEPVAGKVEEGDRIVIAGQAGLKDGSSVRIVGDEA
jgi:membrane fusion protein (multidrug efflux system)